MPIAICGADELYRGKRIALRILDPATVEDLVPEGCDPRPKLGSRQELHIARAITEAVGSRIRVEVGELYASTVDPCDEPRRWS